jgi:hypothetical protein
MLERSVFALRIFLAVRSAVHENRMRAVAARKQNIGMKHDPISHGYRGRLAFAGLRLAAPPHSQRQERQQ